MCIEKYYNIFTKKKKENPLQRKWNITEARKMELHQTDTNNEDIYDFPPKFQYAKTFFLYQ